MTAELRTSINKLYRVFGRYASYPTMDACPCCVSDADKARLLSKPLRELTDLDLSRYSRKALTTWGDLDDFKHFLPRIFDLLAQHALVVDEYILLSKLAFGHWLSWPKQEVESVRAFLMTWWQYRISIDRDFDDLFFSLGKLIGSFVPLLVSWTDQLAGSGFQHLIRFIDLYSESLIGRKWPFKELDEFLRDELRVWLISHLDKVEQAFYQHETINPAWAEELARGYDNLAAIRDFMN